MTSTLRDGTGGKIYLFLSCLDETLHSRLDSCLEEVMSFF